MSDDARRREQAASWLARLRSRAVTTDELTEFAQWRRDPANAAAYRAAEAFWEASGGLDDPDIDDAVDAARRRTQLRWWRTPVVRWVSVGAGLAAIVAAIAVFAMPVPTQTYRTAIGERSFAQLEDDTKVQLDTSTTLTSHFRSRERRVELTEGQAFFDVRHDPARPFVVEAGSVSVTAVGTRFDVSVDRGITTVSLLQGKVQVANHDAGTSVLLSPGESVRVENGVLGRVVMGTTADQTSWRDGRLTFRNTRLDDAVRAINRYTDRPLVLVSSSRSAEPISGDFAVDDVDGFAAAVRTMFGHDAVRREPATQ